MTANPNTRVADLQPDSVQPRKKPGTLTAGSLCAAAFVAMVSLIARKFYR